MCLLSHIIANVSNGLFMIEFSGFHLKTLVTRREESESDTKSVAL